MVMSPAMKEKMAQLRQSYRRMLPEKLAEIQGLWVRAGMKPGRDPAWLELHRKVHSLSGSGTTFGFSRLTQKAQELEAQIVKFAKGEDEPARGDLVRIGAMIEAMEKVVSEQEPLDALPQNPDKLDSREES